MPQNLSQKRTSKLSFFRTFVRSKGSAGLQDSCPIRQCKPRALARKTILMERCIMGLSIHLPATYCGHRQSCSLSPQRKRPSANETTLETQSWLLSELIRRLMQITLQTLNRLPKNGKRSRSLYDFIRPVMSHTVNGPLFCTAHLKSRFPVGLSEVRRELEL